MADTKPTAPTAEQIAEWRDIIRVAENSPMHTEAYRRCGYAACAAFSPLIDALESSQRRAEEAERRVAEMSETLRADAAFLRHYWENYTVGVQTKDNRGYVVNNFAALQIPDWAARQRLDDIDAALRLTEPESEKGGAA